MTWKSWVSETSGFWCVVFLFVYSATHFRFCPWPIMSHCLCETHKRAYVTSRRLICRESRFSAYSNTVETMSFKKIAILWTLPAGAAGRNLLLIILFLSILGILLNTVKLKEDSAPSLCHFLSFLLFILKFKTFPLSVPRAWHVGSQFQPGWTYATALGVAS